MFDPTKFTVQKAKPLPVFLLLDISGSMNEVIDTENMRRTGRFVEDDGQMWEEVEGRTSKVQVLNKAVSTMIDTFANEERMETEFLVSVIVFGDTAMEHLSPTPASSITWTDMTAAGNTVMGAAFALAKKQIEDKTVVPSRAYRPTIVLVSDGEPTDDWKQPLQLLIKEGRSSKCFFMAMGIGNNPGEKVLKQFISQTPILANVNDTQIPNTVFRANDADKIHEFFRKVTMSVTMRSKSSQPNSIPTSMQSDSNNKGYW